MRLEKYLTEKWLDTMKYNNGEIFKNPSKRDYKELDAQYGYRVFIDLMNKNIYVADADVFHKTMMDTSDVLDKELGMNWYAYWSGEDKSNSYMLMGSVNKHMRYFNSDSLIDIAMNGGVPDIKHLRKLLQWDYNWLKKYGYDPKEVKGFVQKRYDELADKLEREEAI